MTLSECRSELRSIINELDDIVYDIRNDPSIEGIGEDLCAASIDAAAKEYKGVLIRLNKVDYSRLASWKEECREG